jgi:hypothetical protein
MTLDSYYFGMIMNVWGPDAPESASKYQYEYQVLVTGEDYASIPCRCIREDKYGSRDDFEDIILAVGTKVMVKFPRGDKSMGVIMHGTRAYVAPQNPALGRYWMNRFNKIVRYIDKNGNYSVTSDAGPNLQVNTNKIVLDDSTGESIVIDKDAATITITAKTWNVNINGDATMTIGGKLTATVTGDATVNADKVVVKAKGSAKVDAQSIELNGQGGQVLTTMTDPVVDSIFGIPTQGVPNVKAGG